jgi:hypothetical protein
MSTIPPLPLAYFSTALEDVGTAATDVVDYGSWLEKGIYWCIPLF